MYEEEHYLMQTRTEVTDMEVGYLPLKPMITTGMNLSLNIELVNSDQNRCSST